MFPRKPKVATNQRVRGTQKTEYNGTLYDSKLEAYCAQLLDNKEIPYCLKPKHVLLDRFTFGEEKVREMSYTPDFEIRASKSEHSPMETIAFIDTKGFPTDHFKLKLKLFKWIHRENPVPIFLPSSQKQVKETIEEIITLIQQSQQAL